MMHAGTLQYCQRLAERQATSWAGSVRSAAGGAPIDCVVTKFSLSGAGLAFVGAMPAADAFHLVLANLQLEIECRVVRRGAGEIAVAFGAVTSLSDEDIADGASGAGVEPGHAECGRLLAILDDIAEFARCGFAAALGNDGDSVLIFRDGRLRGAWTAGPAGLGWLSSGSSEPLAAVDATDAARITFMMVLNTLRVRRAKAAHERSAADARTAMARRT